MDSPNSLVVRIFSRPVRLMQPLMISPPSSASRGRLSPVRAAGVEGGTALYDNAVDGHLFTRLDNDDGAHFHLIGVHLFQLTIHFDVGIVRTDIHEFADVLAAPSHGIALEQFADLIEQHNGNGFGIVAAVGEADDNGAHGGNCHEEVLIEDLTVPDAQDSLPENIIAHDEIGHHVEGEPDKTGDRYKVQRHHQHGGNNDPPEHFFLLFVHRGNPFFDPVGAGSFIIK